MLKNKTQLEELKKAIGDKQVALREKKHSTKYKMVKFFERKKLIRKLQQLEKEDENQQAKDLIIRDLQVPILVERRMENSYENGSIYLITQRDSSIFHYIQKRILVRRRRKST